MSPPHRVNGNSAFHAVIAAYEECGFDSAAIRQWCIPEEDAQALTEHVAARGPKRLLEVGTYVGVSTMLLARAAGPDAAIFSIDPNLRLGAEMGSMGSPLGRLDGDARPHDIARAVAQALGVAQGITFIEGGFASGSTFASSRSDINAVVPVVGPDVCRDFGPFDLIFVDGLHYASAVEADLRLAASALAPGGVILMHDCIGMWGTNVRAGISRFLNDNPDYQLVFPPFRTLYQSIGLIARKDDSASGLLGRREREPSPAELGAAGTSIATSVVNRLKPSLIIELSGARPVAAPAFTRLGVATKVLSANAPKPFSTLQSKVEAALRRSTGEALIVSWGVLDYWPDADTRSFLEWLAASSTPARLSWTPPGERHAAGPHSRSLRRFVDLASSAGLQTATFSSLDTDPVEFAFKIGAERTSACANVVIVGSEAVLRRRTHERDPEWCIPLSKRNAEAVEQARLLHVHYAAAFGWCFDQMSSGTSELGRINEELVSIRRHAAAQVEEAASLRRQVHDAAARCDSLADEASRYKDALVTEQAVNSDLRQQLVSAEAALARAVDEVATLRRHAAEQLEGAAALRREIRDVAARSASLADEANRYNEALTTERATNADLRRQIDEYVGANADLRRQIDEYVGANESLRRQVREVTDALAAERKAATPVPERTS